MSSAPAQNVNGLPSQEVFCNVGMFQTTLVNNIQLCSELFVHAQNVLPAHACARSFTTVFYTTVDIQVLNSNIK